MKINSWNTWNMLNIFMEVWRDHVPFCSWVICICISSMLIFQGVALRACLQNWNLDHDIFPIYPRHPTYILRFCVLDMFWVSSHTEPVKFFGYLGLLEKLVSNNRFCGGFSLSEETNGLQISMIKKNKRDSPATVVKGG